MPDTPRYRSTCLADDCGGRLVIADDGAWHHIGPHGAGLHRPQPADPTPGEEAAYRHGLTAGLESAQSALAADPDGDPLTVVRGVADAYSIVLPTVGDVGGLLDTDEPQPYEVLCAHPGGHPKDPIDGLLRCPDCGDVAVPAPIAHTEPQQPSSAAADRMSWTSGAGLIITPPPAKDPS